MNFNSNVFWIFFFKESIIQTLLDNNARIDIKNRKKQTPCNVAQNAHIQKMFKQYDSMPLVMTGRQKSEVCFIWVTSLKSYPTNVYWSLIHFYGCYFSWILWNAQFWGSVNSWTVTLPILIVFMDYTMMNISWCGSVKQRNR